MSHFLRVLVWQSGCGGEWRTAEPIAAGRADFWRERKQMLSTWSLGQMSVSPRIATAKEDLYTSVSMGALASAAAFFASLV